MKIVFFLAILSIASIIMSCSSDPCDDVTCLNDGYCANGQCVCPEGYSGADCSQQVTPSKLQVTKIVIVKFPATDAGAGWDLTSGPDIRPVLSIDGQIIWDTDEFYQNADPNYSYEFETGTNTYIDNPSGRYTMNLYDYDDFDADDFMGGVIFTPYNKSNNFPSIIKLDAGGDVAFELYVNYNF